MASASPLLLSALSRYEIRQLRLVENLLHFSPRHVEGQLFGFPLQLLDKVVLPRNEVPLVVPGVDSEPNQPQFLATGGHNRDRMTCWDDEKVAFRETSGDLLVLFGASSLLIFFLLLSPLLPPLSREMRAGHFHFSFPFHYHAQDRCLRVVMRYEYRPLQIEFSDRHFIKRLTKPPKK